MKIAIPLDDNKRDVCAVLSRTPFFLFWEDGQETVSANPAAQAESGAGVQAAQYLVDNNISILITPRCGQNAADVFSAADIKIYKTEGTIAAENISAYREGRLEALTHFHGGFHGQR